MSFRLLLSRPSSAAPTTPPSTTTANSSAATDGRNFQVILAGNPFPGVDPNIVARDLLPAMQAAKPRPALTFTYDPPSKGHAPTIAWCWFSIPPSISAPIRCAAASTRFRPGRPGLFYLYAVYCRNDQAMSETTAWTPATGPDDPRIQQLFRELFQVVFSDFAGAAAAERSRGSV